MNVMKLFVALAITYIALCSHQSYAQLACITQYGSCLIAPSGQNGAPCYCNTPNGPLSGFTQMQGPAVNMSNLPHFCCTQYGRFGPFQNANVPAGGICQAITQNGAVYGQACY